MVHEPVRLVMSQPAVEVAKAVPTGDHNQGCSGASTLLPADIRLERFALGCMAPAFGKPIPIKKNAGGVHISAQKSL